MNLGPKSLALFACFTFSGVLAVAQTTPCVADGETPGKASPIACVTGEGVQVTAATTPAQSLDILPLTPEQRPAAVPVVAYADGKLTVVANNSTLGDILRAIAAKTGASIDIPTAASERVVSQLGPAPARDVMAALLNGSHYNYVMVGTENNPNSVAHVILTAKSDRPEGSAPAIPAATMATRQMVQPRTALQAAVMQPYQEMMQQQQAQQEAATELQKQIVESVPTMGQSNIEPAATSSAAINIPAASDTNSDGGAIEAPPSPETPRATNSNGEKTPQQVLQDLYETRKQMMQQQHQPPAQAPPQ
jgi:hypothetical protein